MKTIRFIHMSDIHYRETYSDSGFEALIANRRHPQENFYKCIAAEKENGLDFVLITGDLAHEGEERDYRILRGLLEEQLGSIPFIALPGNHDKQEAFCKGFLGVESKKNLDDVYEIEGLRIIVMDTGRTINGIITKDQIKWLKNVLGQPCERGSILALHHPLIENQDGLPSAQYDNELYEVIENSNILGIFCGHTHHNYISQFASKPYFTVDSMSYSMTSVNDDIQFEDYVAYNIMQLHDNVLSAQVKQVIPAPTVIASFSSDKLTQLFSK